MPTFFTREILRRWLLALGCFAAVLFFFSPSWGAFTLWSRVPEMSGMLEVRRGASVLEQVAHPGAEISDPLHQAIQWRLFFPVIGHFLHLSALVLFGLSDLGCVVVLAYLVTLLRRHRADWWSTAGAVIVLGATSWLFVSTGWLGYFDSWLALALLLVTFAPTRWPVWLACLGAPWIDERFVMAAPVAFLCRWVYVTAVVKPPTAGTDEAKSSASAAGTSFDFKWEFGIPAALLGAFLLVRLGLLSGSSAKNATVAGYLSARDYLDAPPGRILLGVWEGLRASWIFVIAAVVLLRGSPTRAAAIAIGALLTIAGGLYTAQDYSRSMTMLLPVAVLGAVMVVQTRPVIETKLLATAVALGLLLPAHHVMNDRVNPIFYLYHELAALDSPPPTAMPELREYHAISLLEQGQYAEAEAELTLAIKLSDHPASPAQRRGRLYASAQRWDEAKRDFSLMIADEPDNPDGWFLRSEVELALRNLEAARTDFDKARSTAPAGWSDRPDVKGYTALLNRQLGQR